MSEPKDVRSFFPSGAVAFFVGMIVFYAGLWFVLYYLMAQRG